MSASFVKVVIERGGLCNRQNGNVLIEMKKLCCTETNKKMLVCLTYTRQQMAGRWQHCIVLVAVGLQGGYLS